MARQPIFNRENEVYAYELLARSNAEGNVFSVDDGDTATSGAMANLLFDFGIAHVIGDKKAFVNFTQTMLEEEVPTLLPKDQVVLEVLETVRPNKRIMDALLKLKGLGYIIAMDDFAFTSEMYPFVELADIIKVDLTMDVQGKLGNIRSYAMTNKVVLLAEKIETWRECEQAKDMGYTLFQGYYFSRPVLISGKRLQPQKKIYLRMLNELMEAEPDFSIIATLIEHDPILTFEILSLTNSSVYTKGHKVQSIHEALTLVGLCELKKWAFVTLLLHCEVEGAPSKKITQGVLRAKFLENIANELETMRDRSSECFLLGVVSSMGGLFDRKPTEILNETAVSAEVVAAILNGEGKFAELLKLVEAYEKAKWDTVNAISQELNLADGLLSACYFKALDWVNWWEGIK